MPRGKFAIADRHAVEFAKLADNYAATARAMFHNRAPIKPGGRETTGVGHGHFTRSYLKRVVAHARAMREIRYWAGAASDWITRCSRENTQLAHLAETLLDEKENEFLKNVQPVGQA